MKENKPQWNDGQEIEDTAPSWDDGQDMETPEDISYLESGLRGAAQGASMGSVDEITGFLESLVSDKTYEEARDESREAYKEAEEANPATYLSGDLAGSVGTAFIPGLGIAKGASLAAQAGKLGAMGAVEGFNRSEEEGLELAKDTAIGGAIGAALPGALKVGGKALGKAKKLIPGTEGAVTNKLVSVPNQVVFGTGEATEEALSNPGLRRQAKELGKSGKKGLANLAQEASEDINVLDDISNMQMGNVYSAGEESFFESLSKADMKQMNMAKFSPWQSIAAKAPVEMGKSVKYIRDTLSIMKYGGMDEAQGISGHNVKTLFKAKVITGDEAAKIQGKRLLDGKRYLADIMENKNWDNLLRNEKKQISTFKSQIDETLKGTSGGEHLKEVDELYSRFKGAKSNALNKIEQKTPDGVREITPEKLESFLKSGSQQAKWIDRSMKEFEEVLKEVGKKDVIARKAKDKTLTSRQLGVIRDYGPDSIMALKDLRDMSNMASTLGALSTSAGGMGAQAIKMAMTSAGGIATGGLSLLALPITNPTIWLRLLDGADAATKAVLNKIAAASKKLGSSNPREMALLKAAMVARDE